MVENWYHCKELQSTNQCKWSETDVPNESAVVEVTVICIFFPSGEWGFLKISKDAFKATFSLILELYDQHIFYLFFSLRKCFSSKVLTLFEKANVDHGTTVREPREGDRINSSMLFPLNPL
jgi:hypothetical protein